MSLTETTRRNVVRTSIAGGAAVLAPSYVDVVSGQTDSGEVELSTTATVPSSTSIDATVYEDTSGSGVADSSETNTISDGSDTIAYSTLSGNTTDGATYWIQFDLETTDDTVTPELDNATITLPEGGTDGDGTGGDGTGGTGDTPGSPEGIFDLWDNFLVFVALAVTGISALGAIASRSMAIGAFSGYLLFVYIGVTTGDTLLTNITYVTLVLVMIGMAFKLWRLEFGGST